MSSKKIFLVTLSPKSHRTSEENLGIAYLKSSLVSKGYNVEIIDAWLNEYSVDEVANKILNNKDNILFVGISSYMSNTVPSVELIKKLKENNRNIKIVCGGFGPSFYPNDYLMSGSDYIIRGEGEEAICELAYCIENKIIPSEIKNIGFLENGIIKLNNVRCLTNSLDDFPFPSRDTINVVLEKKSTVNMITARGCSGSCEFCSVISFFRLGDGKVWRTRSIKNIVDEIEELYKQGVEYIKMVDDSFVDGNRDEKWCKDFADEIERRNIKVKLRGQIRADKINDVILKELKRAGFFSFACGIENGSNSALKRMNKKATLKDNEQALELFKQNGYLVQMGYILFDKETTLKELEENYNFMCKYDFAITKGIFSEMYSAEGTNLNKKLRENNELQSSNFLENNNKYKIDDEIVRKVYDAVKIWHLSHSKVYDMTIDPLTAPKALSFENLKEFYLIALELKKKDLLFFKFVLELAKENPSSDFQEFTENYIDLHNFEYLEILKNVNSLYQKNNLSYNADINPFIRKK